MRLCNLTPEQHYIASEFMRYNMLKLRSLAEAKSDFAKIRATGHTGLIGLVCLDNNGDLVILRQLSIKHAMVKRIIARYAEVRASREAGYRAKIAYNRAG